MLVAVQTQAPDIAQKVYVGKADEDVGAGDQVAKHFVSILCIYMLNY